MSTSSNAQAVVDELNAATANVPAALAAVAAKADAQSAEDLAAIKTASDALVAAINAATAT